MRETIENVQVIDPEGNDVTPEKVKEAQKRKFKTNQLTIRLKKIVFIARCLSKL